MKKLLMTTAALAAFSASPMALTSSLHSDHFSFMTTAEAGNGNSGSHGNNGGNGNGGNGNGGNAGNSGNSDHGNAASSGKDNANANGNANVNSDNGRDDDTNTVDTDARSNGDILSKSTAKEKNLRAVLGRINSIGRNVNALMTSKDPHLAGIRTYVLNSVELAKAQTEADSAQAAYDAALANYADAGLTGDPAMAISQLNSAVVSADPSSSTELYAQIDLAKAVITASNNLVATEARVAQYSVLTSDAALGDALALMSNRNLASAEISAATLDWTKAVLGVGDATGAIDTYMAESP